MARMFGTDGVRGLANKDITVDLAVKLGEAGGRVLAKGVEGRRPRAIIGRDTRQSSPMLSHALGAGLAAAGIDVEHAREIPTPGIAYLTAEKGYDLGVVISASHNAMPDNGIKFISSNGFKLDDSVEDEIEAVLGEEWERPTGEGVGRVTENSVVTDRAYMDHLVACGEPLKGLRIALDCANGAASEVAPTVFRELGADVVVINAEPDGRNINLNAGSTHPEALQAMVVAAGADMGFAFDGDADRCLAVDEDGNLVDGDQIMGLLAVDLKEQGKLANNTLVITVMSNLGLRLAMKEKGIDVAVTGVGDRYVLEEMLAKGYVIGGEQSGHVIDLEHATTGDGTLTAILVSSIVARKGGPKLSELVGFVKRLPQTLINVRGVDKTATDKIAAEVAQAEAELGETGRVLLRASGTEPLVRVMVEAATQKQADDVAKRLAAVVEEKLAL
ncbi:phosphoglucosamine mutase [Arcanobacterium wilhelmae]|uniref:Phosphoglucosamine mutase n=1 Tax=Arcanobacterium wilhelmae TaxID=1803177 RepID=A0ABT9NCG8_9ACTO|nr:phosphoglucosamine mutase [Arcanobacterium wilhelmae]MDP9801417.1 phosphoglucosamine mutase [Arcanobacterium wilhelmae]WFN90752.1 phosphoglucosamine mutase [Arcanobacterium wilhelmae]